jgi:type VI protein secretion system component Hcp
MKSSIKYLALILVVFSYGGASYAQNNNKNNTGTYASGPFYLQLGGTDMGEILAWSWGASFSVNTGSVGGGGAGKANLGDMSIVRYIDANSPPLLQRLLSGQQIPEVVLSSANMEINLKQVYVTAYAPGGTSERNTAMTEALTLSFDKVQYTVNGVSTCWDHAMYKAC